MAGKGPPSQRSMVVNTGLKLEDGEERSTFGMKEKKYRSITWVKFLAFSALGIFIFFINVTIAGSKNVPMLQIINWIKAAVPANANMWLVALICLFTLATSLWARLPNAPAWIRNHHAKDNLFSYFTYITAAIFCYGGFSCRSRIHH